MHHLHRSILAAAAVYILSGTAALAASNETWVSGMGSDAGACSASAPCRTFAFALTQTNAGGSINVLQSGNFGSVTINKSLTIETRGTVAHSSGTIVNPGANDVVVLRGLTEDPNKAPNVDGIRVASGKALHVEKCVIRRAFRGIRFSPVAGGGVLTVPDTSIEDSSDGISVHNTGSSTTTRIAIEHVRAVNNAIRMVFSVEGNGAKLQGSVTDSVVAEGQVGLKVSADTSISGSRIDVLADRVVSIGNQDGIHAFGGNAAVAIDQADVSGNRNLGLRADNSGEIVSFETNQIRGNTTNGAPNATIALQ